MIIENIAIEKIVLPKKFEAHPNDVAGLHLLANSISQFGMKMPLLVSKIDQGFRLIDGKKRLNVWRLYNLGREVPCIVLDESQLQPKRSCPPSFTMLDSITEEENNQEIYELYTMVAVNLVRSKMDKTVLEEIVKFLHKNLKLGYGTIAKRLGYSKAGIQKILGRLEKEELNQTADPSKPPIHYMKRLRTELKKLAETISSDTDDADKVMEAIRCLHDYLDSLIQSV